MYEIKANNALNVGGKRMDLASALQTDATRALKTFFCGNLSRRLWLTDLAQSQKTAFGWYLTLAR